MARPLSAAERGRPARELGGERHRRVRGAGRRKHARRQRSALGARAGRTRRRYSSAAFVPLKQIEPMPPWRAKKVPKSLTTALATSIANRGCQAAGRPRARPKWRSGTRRAARDVSGRTMGPRIEQNAHDPPKSVLRLSVILAHFERFSPWQTSENENSWHLRGPTGANPSTAPGRGGSPIELPVVARGSGAVPSALTIHAWRPAHIGTRALHVEAPRIRQCRREQRSLPCRKLAGRHAEEALRGRFHPEHARAELRRCSDRFRGFSASARSTPAAARSTPPNLCARSCARP